MDAGDNSARLLYSGTGPSANGSPGAKPGWVYDEDDAGETAAAGDVPAGVDPETGVIEGECLEETDDAGEPTRQTFGDKPTEDKHIPAGTHEGKMLSDVCRDDPDYARSTFLSADSVKAVTEQWLRYWHGNGPAKGDFQDVKF
jgi:hypothetical protein